MLRYLKKLENFQVKHARIDNKYRNDKGPMYISEGSYQTKLGEAFLESGKEMGYSVIDDFNGEKQAGFSRTQVTMRNGERWSTNRAYLHPARHRGNLFLTRDSYVNRVLIHKRSKLAYGIQFTKFGDNFEVRARKEIILSAGAIKSPQILMLSGVGPLSHLQNLNINVLKDAPVGENLMDHVAIQPLSFKTNFSETQTLYNPSSSLNSAVRDYLNNKTGRLAFLDVEAVSFTNAEDPNSTDPNLELLFSSNVVVSNVTMSHDNMNNSRYGDSHQMAVWKLGPIALIPKSRGRLLLRSNLPKDKPQLFPNYLSEPEDVRVLIKGIRMIQKLSQTKAFQRYNSTPLNLVPLDNCKHLEFDSDKYWECVVRTNTFSHWHYSGTCKMGKQNDPTSVVNPEAQVIGIQGLRVVDASIIPKLGRYHTNIPVIAIAEKLSDVIKSYWNLN